MAQNVAPQNVFNGQQRSLITGFMKGWSGRASTVCVVTLVCMVTYCLPFLGAQVSEKCSDPCGAG